MSKKIVVENREAALALIAAGTNSMLIFSAEAPHGYKKDGTPSAPRGRKALNPEIKAAREEKARNSTRKKPGPIVRTADAPYGVKADGTPMLKRGRRPKTETPVPDVAPVAVIATLPAEVSPVTPTEAVEGFTVEHRGDEPESISEPLATEETPDSNLASNG